MNDQCNTCDFYDLNTEKCKLQTDWVYASFQCPLVGKELKDAKEEADG